MVLRDNQIATKGSAHQIEIHDLLETLEEFGDAAWAMDQEGQYMASPVWRRLLGLATDHYDLAQWLRRVDPAFQFALKERVACAFEHDQVSPAEYALTSADGERLWLRERARMIQDRDGQSWLVVTVDDCTAERRTLEEARIYRTVVEDQTELIVRWQPGGIRTFVNDAYCEYFGVSCDEAVGTSFFPLIVPEHQQAVKAKIAGLTPDHPVAVDTHLSHTAQGETRWQQWIDRATFDAQGNPVEYQSVGRDVTDLKRAEEEAREAQRTLRSRNESLLAVNRIVDRVFALPDLDSVARESVKAMVAYTQSPSVAFFILDDSRQWLHLRANAGFAVDLVDRGNTLPVDGTLSGQAMGTQQVLVVDDLTDVQGPVAPLVRMLVQQGFVSACIIPLLHGDRPEGAMVLIFRQRFSSTTVETDTFAAIGKAIGLAIANARHTEALQREIGERRDAEEALRRHEAHFRRALSSAHVATWEWDIETGQLSWAGDVEALLGSEESRHGRRYGDYLSLIHPDDRLRVKKSLDAAIEEGATHYGVEHRICWPDGSVRWLLGQGRIHRDGAGRAERMLGTVSDITQRKQVEQQLVESESMLKLVLDTIPARVFWKDSELRYLGCNRLFSSDAGLDSPEEIVGRTDYDLPWTDRADAYRRDDREVVASRHPKLHYEELVTAPDGRQLIVETSKVPLTDSQGRSIGVLGTFQEITERKAAEQALRASEERFELAVKGSNDGFWDWPDSQSETVWWSPRFFELLGYESNEFQPTLTRFFALLHPEDRQRFRDALDQHMQRRVPFDMVYRLRRKHGGYRWFRARGQGLWDEQGNATRMAGSIQDITEARAAEEALRRSEERYRAFIANSREGIWRCDVEPPVAVDAPRYQQVRRISERAVIAECNDALARMYDQETAEDLIGRRLVEVVDKRAYLQLARRFVAEGYHLDDAELKRTSGSGHTVWLTNSVSGIVENGALVRIWGTARDITERMVHQAALEFQATHDSLTQLPNRISLYQRLEEVIARGEPQRLAAVLLIDLNRFKEINDTLGHHTGDLLLRRVGPRLKTLADQQSATLARLGGDEFAILLPSVDNEGQAVEFARRAERMIRRPFTLEGANVEIGASIGMAFFPPHGDTPSTLMRCADVAMYHAKSRATGVSVYNPEHDAHAERRLAVITELSSAIRNDHLVLHYQPKVNLTTGTVLGMEALIRWQHPQHGLITPNNFVPLAEMGEVVRPLSRWVIDRALAQWRQWRDQGLDLKIAVNLSARNLLDEDLPGALRRAMAKYQADADSLELEVTESAVMADPVRALGVLHRIRDMGVRLSIDDFGTGYTSLAHLKRFPIQVLKIDLSFVTNMVRSDHDAVIVNSIISLAHNLGLLAIAEGVENEAIFDALRQETCDEAQGFFISPPMPAPEVPDWLTTSGWGVVH